MNIPPGLENNSNNLHSLLNLLESIADDPAVFSGLDEDSRIRLLRAAGKISRPDRDTIRQRNKVAFHNKKMLENAEDRQARSLTGLREARKSAVFSAPLRIQALPGPGGAERELKSPRNCYVCKTKFTRLHHFYDALCPECADYNYQKRFQTASLDGRVAVITGARLKIGYHATLMMLRAGATVLATTRFPVDAALRFSREADYPLWKDRLQVHGLDLRHTPSVELFSRYLETHLQRLDILINNAAQTVRRPPGFYTHLLGNETLPFENQSPEVRHLLSAHHSCVNRLDVAAGNDSASALPANWQGLGPGIGIRASARLSQVPYSYDSSVRAEEVFPDGQLDADLQQVDLRETNSWRLKLAEVPTPEMLEVQLVNAVAPFVLCSRLAPIMRRDYTGQKHIVNVTAMEGKFYRFTKPDRHPHTNMAKAALNMLTHTSASDLEKDAFT
jgi:NAD(P)-dependent dehydrogenase (short-subunit alcohol dehydrogenase family)